MARISLEEVKKLVFALSKRLFLKKIQALRHFCVKMNRGIWNDAHNESGRWPTCNTPPDTPAEMSLRA